MCVFFVSGFWGYCDLCLLALKTVSLYSPVLSRNSQSLFTAENRDMNHHYQLEWLLKIFRGNKNSAYMAYFHVTNLYLTVWSETSRTTREHSPWNRLIGTHRYWRGNYGAHMDLHHVLCMFIYGCLLRDFLGLLAVEMGYLSPFCLFLVPFPSYSII